MTTFAPGDVSGDNSSSTKSAGVSTESTGFVAVRTNSIVWLTQGIRNQTENREGNAGTRAAKMLSMPESTGSSVKQHTPSRDEK